MRRGLIHFAGPVAGDRTEVPEPDEKPQSDAPSAGRLVIRVRLPSQAPPQAPAPQPLNKGALLLIAGVAAVLLGWIGISVFRTDPTSAPAATEQTPSSQSQPPAATPAPTEAAPVVSAEPLPKADAPTSASNEVIPDVPRSARQTIRGTIIVSVRVTVGKEGTVLDATAVERGPSRYFERLAVEAAKKWTFTPVNRDEQRTKLITFSFTRGGTKGRAN
jgi:TonB family protein